MPKRVSYDFAGLVTNASVYTRPPGAMTTLDNFDLASKGRLTRRLAFRAQTETFGGPVYSLISNPTLGAQFLANYGSSTTPGTLRIGDGSAPTSLVGRIDGAATAYPNTIDARMHAAISLRNQYLTTRDGPVRIETDVASTLVGYFAGMPRAPGLDQTFVTGGNYGVIDAVGLGYGAGANWLANGSSVAYRCVWVTTDADGVELVSAPSGRWIVTNSAGAARVVRVRALIPTQTRCTTAVSIAAPRIWKLRLYRSPDVAGTPIDEMQLVFEKTPSAGDVAAGYTELEDLCPSAAMGAYLYTNTVSGGDVGTTSVRSQNNVGDGILASNDYPPIAKDVAAFRDCMFYANLTLPPRLTFSILAVGVAGNSLQVGNVITINGAVNLNAVAAPVAANEFQPFGGGTASENIRRTAINLCEAINRYANSNALVVATYLGNDNAPGTIGKILLEAKDGKTAFSIAVSVGSSLPYIGMPASSVSESWGNGLAFSKPLQADAVPPANVIRIGRNDTTIKRIAQLGDSLFVFNDAGLWRVRGRTPNDFFVEEFDRTFRLLAPETVVECENALYAWGQEGIARIDETGVQFIDVPIRDTVRSIVAVSPTLQAPRAFAVAYRLRRRVLFFYSSDSSVFYATRALVWNLETGTWTAYDVSTAGLMNCGAVRPTDDRLFLADWSNAGDGYIYREEDAAAGNPYEDRTRTGTGNAITCTATWNTVAEDVETLCDWHATEFNFEVVDPSSTSVTVTHVTEYTSASQSVAIGNNGNIMEVVPPTTALSSRHTLTIAEAFRGALTLSAAALIYTPVSPLNNKAG